MSDLVTVDRLQEQQEAFVDAIVSTKGANLPATIENLIPVLAFSSAKMKAYQALCDASKKVAEQEELNEAALASGQRWGIVHLYGQKRLGDLTREMPVKRATPSTRPDVHDDHALSVGKKESLSNQGVHYKSYQDAERIAAHPEVLERVIAESEERKEIPTKTAVLREIKRDDRKRWEAENPVKKTPPSIAEQQYLVALRKAAYTIPAEPPRDWSEDGMKEARSIVAIIKKRLEVFGE